MAIYKKYAKAYEILTNSNMDYEGDEPIKHIYNRFIAEYNWNIQRIGFHRALTEWLQGLALDIPYTYVDIHETFGTPYEKMGNYWQFMAMRLTEMFKKDGLLL